MSKKYGMSPAGRFVAIMALIGLSAPIHAEVPVASSGLAECAGLMHVMSDLAEGDERAVEFGALAAAWSTAGIEKAREEGHFYPEFFVEAAKMSAADEWRRISARQAFEELLDQKLKQCDALAERGGVFQLAGEPG